MSPYGEQLAENDQDTPKSQSMEERVLRDKLTAEEVKRLDDGQITTHQLAAERRMHREQADRELNQMVTGNKATGQGPLITLKEFGDLRRELENTPSPQRTKEILDKIRKLAQQKERDQNTAEAENQELDPEHPRLLALQKKFDETVDNNKLYIGSGQLEGFKAWFKEERQKTPTVTHLKEQIKRLEGKEIVDKKGLAPRREMYESLNGLFKKFDAGKPTDNPYIEKEGLSERTQFHKNAQKMLGHLEQRKDVGFYSPECIKTIMQETLNANNPDSQAKLMETAESIAKQESTAFSYFDGKIDIAGKTITKMSKASKKMYMDYYKNTTFKERATLVKDWKDLVDNEGNLATQLQEIYKDDVKGLHLALDKFQTLNFLQKQEELKKHEELVKNSTEKDARHKKLLLDATEAKLKEALGEKTICRKTAERYQALAKDENNYKNPETKKPGDVKVLEKMYNTLTSPVPIEAKENRNLAAYEKRRNEFKKDLIKLQLVNPRIENKEIDQWQERYDEGTWSKRTLTKIALKDLLAKEELKAQKRREKEGSADIDQKDKKEANEVPKEKSKVIEAAVLHMSEDDPTKALKLLLLFDEQSPDDPQILFMIEMAAKQKREHGSKKKGDPKFEKQIEEEATKVANNEVVRKDLEEAQIVHLNIDGAKQSEERHEKKKMGQERAEDESMVRAAGDNVEQELTEAYYEQTDDKHILNKEGTGEEMTKLKMDSVRLTDEQRHAAKLRTYQNQDRLTHKEGLIAQFSDKTGRILNAAEAATMHEKKLEEITDTIADQSQDRVETKNAGENRIKGAFDVQQRVSAKRAARKFVDKKINERFKQAA